MQTRKDLFLILWEIYISDSLSQVANEELSMAIPSLRKALGISTTDEGVIDLHKLFTGRELIHSCYFENDDIIDLIALHILENTLGIVEAPGIPNCDNRQWWQSLSCYI